MATKKAHKKQNKAYKIILSIALSFILLSLAFSFALALGISPANKAIQIIPGKEQIITYKIYNEDGNQKDLIVNINGSLKKYIKADKKEIMFKENEKIKKLVLRIKIPEDIDAKKIKDNTIKINIVEKSKKINLDSSLKINMPTAYLIKINKDKATKNKEPKSKQIKTAQNKKIEKTIVSIKDYSLNILSKATDSRKKIIINTVLIALIISSIALFAFTKKTSGLEETQISLSQIQNMQKKFSKQDKKPQYSFITREGLALKNISDLFFYLKNINDNVFYNYVNNEKNDFALWLSKINESSVALDIYDTTDREEMLNKIKKHIMLRKAIEIEKNNNIGSIYDEIRKINNNFN